MELLAVTSIITIITLLLLLRQSKFDSSTILRSVAYSVALSVRQTQVYGVSVLGASNAGSVQYAPAYGLYFSDATPASYILFADFNNNGTYDPASETVKVFSPTSGYVISEVCALTSGAKRCTGADDTAGGATIHEMSILFKRPNPDAQFTTDFGGNDAYVSAWVQVRSPDGTTRSVVVTSAGQITVQAPGTLP